ncbi:hypothetical protein ABZ354_25030 [Streptomyces sp. NPDC005925]|uniref:hypothetical protein n=1 Tax=Streptomyces sp. NPDC005925 TaxID=3157172 RepID=UPI0033D8D27A
MPFGADGRGVASLGFGRLRSLLGPRALAGGVTCPFGWREGTQKVDKVQELSELTPRLVQVADHSVLTAADFPVLLTQSGDAGLELFEDLQAALRDVTVQRCQPDRRVIETCELLSYRSSSFMASPNASFHLT